VHKFWIDQLFILFALSMLPLQRLRLAFLVFSSSGVFLSLALTDLPRFRRVLDSFIAISINCPSRTSIGVRLLAAGICDFTYFLLLVNTFNNLFVIYLNESSELPIHINFYEDQNKVISKHSK
jgi:ABC-type nitrate/sulfonate/bicarbonate transport system permease component